MLFCDKKVSGITEKYVHFFCNVCHLHKPYETSKKTFLKCISLSDFFLLDHTKYKRVNCRYCRLARYIQEIYAKF